VTDRPGADPGAHPLRFSDLLFLLALASFVTLAMLAPLSSFALFGSDTGEYYRLTQMLVAQGHLPIGGSFNGGYAGWGYGYPDFPGLFLVVGAGAGALHVDVYSALIVLVPALTALAVLPLFLLFRRLYPSDPVAILGAGFAAVAMPRLFSIAHPAPLAIGDLFVVGGLWMFVEGRRDVRWYPPLAVLGGALIITHHLSSYFFLLSALGGLLLLEMWRPGAWSRRFPSREFAFLAAFTSAMLLYWVEYATDFRQVLETGGFASSVISDPIPLIAGTVISFVALALLVRWRRGIAPGRRRRVRLPSDASLLRDGLLISAIIAGGLALLLIVHLPGTTQGIGPETLLWFSPFIVFAAFAAGSRRLLGTTSLGPFTLTWVVALGLSAAFAIATSANGPGTVLIPSRHAEYLVIPLGLMVAVVLGYLALRVEGVAGRRGLVAFGIALVLLLGANAAIAYPPPQDFGGFQEGLTPQDAAVWMWAGVALPDGTVAASDHRLSSMLFGFDGFYASWQNTPDLFVGQNWSEAVAELRSTAVPHCPYRAPIEIVVVDSVMYQGVALDPSAIAQPLSSSAQAWFAHAPFVPIYLNGQQAVYWVDGPLDSPSPVGSCQGT
jgi:hypothetical protein